MSAEKFPDIYRHNLQLRADLQKEFEQARRNLNKMTELMRRLQEMAPPLAIIRPAKAVEPTVEGELLPEPLACIADALVDAHAFTEEDGDRLTKALIEAAIMHVGKRVARRLASQTAESTVH